MLTHWGWVLSPAYDINPSIDKDGLALNIDSDNNSLDFDLAKSVGKYFNLSLGEMNSIIQDVTTTVKGWRIEAKKIGIQKAEQDMMEGAFKF